MLFQFFISIFFMGVGMLSIYGGFHNLMKGRLIRDLPTSHIKSLAMGIVEIKGKARAINTYISPISKEKCIAYRLEIVNPKKESSTGVFISTSTHEFLKKVPVGISLHNFLVEDDTGIVEINPKGAEIHLLPNHVYISKGYSKKTIDALTNHSFKGGKEKLKIITEEFEEVPLKLINSFARNGEYLYYEYVIKEEEELYVLGTYGNTKKNKRGTIIRKGKNDATFIISNRSEDCLSGGLLKEIWIIFFAGVVFFLAGLGMLLSLIGVL